MSSQTLGRAGNGRGFHMPDNLHWPERLKFKGFSRSPHLRIPTGGGKSFQVATDRVRAVPAITPSIALGLAMGGIGLGMWGVLFPKTVARTFGLPRNDLAIRTLFGARELATSYRLAGDPTKAESLWARVAGDVLDITVLSAASVPQNRKRHNARFALKAVLLITALDVLAAVRMSNVQRNCVD
jgi:hypothetical protein